MSFRLNSKVRLSVNFVCAVMGKMFIVITIFFTAINIRWYHIKINIPL